MWLWQKYTFHFTTTWTTVQEWERVLLFFCFGTTFTTPWWRKKVFIFIHYAMVTGKRNLVFITPLPWLRSWKEYSCFWFHYDVFYANNSLHLPIRLTTSLICRESLLSRKICITQKTFFLRNFSAVFHDLLLFHFNQFLYWIKFFPVSIVK